MPEPDARPAAPGAGAEWERIASDSWSATASVDGGWGYPTFSLAERDRRWGRVRELMAANGIDCLVAPPATGIQGRQHADVKYLSQMGQNDELFGVVFPIEGEPVVTGWPGARPGDAWITERTGLDGGFAAPLAWSRTQSRIVDELGFGAGTIGVCGLGPGGPAQLAHTRQPEGFVPVASMRAFEERLPRATFVDAGCVLGPARYVKGEEEVEFLRIGTSIAERALAAMQATARTQAFEPQVYAAMLAAEVAVGGSLPTMISWSAGPLGSPNARLEQAVARRLRSGDLVSVEVEGRWASYNGQVDATMTVGDVPDWAAEGHQVAHAALTATMAAMAPDVTFGSLRRVAESVEPSEEWQVRLIVHGRGLGDDGPLVGADGPMDDLVLEEQTVFSVKPAVMYRGAYCARIGETVVVRATGAERLGRRPLDHPLHVD